MTTPDSVEDLLAVLAREPLDPLFEHYGDFVIVDQPMLRGVCVVSFFGNFANLSHVFDLSTSDRSVSDRLTAAIRANQKTEAYLSIRTERLGQCGCSGLRGICLLGRRVP